MAKRKTATAEAVEVDPATEIAAPVLAYKGFNADLTCRDFQFEIGKTFIHEGCVEVCQSGFHACEHPLHVLKYYRPGTSRFAVVSMAGKLLRHGDDSKIAAAEITIQAEITLPALIQTAIQYVIDKCGPAKVQHATKSNEAATASGNSGAATASGNSGAATASGNYGAATASGNSGAATASGYSGAATASGYSGAATASGYSGAATASGDSGAATASGYYGAATASGNSGAATASGDYGAATASGYYGHASALGRGGKAQASAGGSFTIREFNRSGNLIAVFSAIPGVTDGIKPDTFYRLKNGKPVEV